MNGAALHRADNDRLAQSRRARGHRRLRTPPACRQGLESLFLVPTGRGRFISDMTPSQYDEVLASLYQIQRKYDGRMLVNAKCAPHYIKTVLEKPSNGRDSGLRTFRRWPDPRRSGSTPEEPAAARPARTTWASGRTGMSRRARISRFLPGRFATPAWRISGPPRSCSPASASARRSAAAVASAR